MKKSIKIVIGAIIFFLIIINVFLNDPTFKNPLDTIDFALKSKQYVLAEQTYRNLIQQDSINLDYYYGHITSHFKIPKEKRISKSNTQIRDDSKIYEFYKNISQSIDQNQRSIGYYGLGLYYSSLHEYEDALRNYKKVENKNLKYLNNSIGFIHLQNFQYEIAEDFLLKEINSNGNLIGAYSNLIALYLKTNKLDKLDSFIKSDIKAYFSSGELREFYLKSANYGKYFIQIITIGYRNIDMKSFIAALIIMLIWLFYLRRLDLFEPEKWTYIISTFILGIVFSYGAFILYDLAEHKLGFALNENVVNDFFYCFLGIGIIEESVKLLPFLIILRFTKEANEPIDYIIYPSISALGFAFAENIQYFHGIGLDIIHGRALISVVIHMFCSSIIGYGIYFGIANFKINRVNRLIIFLLIAAFIHGLFDFWLLNEKVKALSIISFFMVIAAISVWNSLINNALNFSIPENESIGNLNHKKLQDYLIYCLSGVLIFEYILVSISYGPKIGNESLFSAAYSGTFLIAFISSSLSLFQIKKNYRAKIQLYNKNSVYFDAILGERIEIVKFNYDDNNIFPLKGQVFSREEIHNEKNWYVVKLDEPIAGFRTCKDYIIIKPKKRGDIIEKEVKKVVGVYLIKHEDMLQKKTKTKRDLLYIEFGIVK